MKIHIKTFIYYSLIMLLVTVVYLFLMVYLTNFTLFQSVIFSPFPVSTKFQLVKEIIIGWPLSMTLQQIATTLSVAVLTGINAALLLYRIRVLASYGSLHLVVGGGSLLGLVSSGCASCGLPILALVGLGGSVSMLPLQGYELSIVSILLLCLSIYFIIKNIRIGRQCKVERKGK